MKKLIFVFALIVSLGACANMCDNCYNGRYYGHEEAYTVSKPVEVIYKNTTYKTVYEPKTYKEVTMERRPIKNGCYRVNHKNYCN